MVKSAAERRTSLIRLVESKTVTRVEPQLLLPALPYLDLAGEEFGRSLLLTTAGNGVEYCLRPDFTMSRGKRLVRRSAVPWYSASVAGSPKETITRAS